MRNLKEVERCVWMFLFVFVFGCVYINCIALKINFVPYRFFAFSVRHQQNNCDVECLASFLKYEFTHMCALFFLPFHSIYKPYKFRVSMHKSSCFHAIFIQKINTHEFIYTHFQSFFPTSPLLPLLACLAF